MKSDTYPYAIFGDLVAAGEARPLVGPPFAHEVFTPELLIIKPHEKFTDRTLITLVGPRGGRVTGKPCVFAPDAPPVSLEAVGSLAKRESLQIFVSNFAGRLHAVVLGHAEGASQEDLDEAVRYSATGAPKRTEARIHLQSNGPVPGEGQLEIMSEPLLENFTPLRVVTPHLTFCDAFLTKNGEQGLEQTAMFSEGEKRFCGRVLNMPREMLRAGDVFRVRLQNGNREAAELEAWIEGEFRG